MNFLSFSIAAFVVLATTVASARESDSELELRDAEGNTIKVAVADIAERSPVVFTMPPIIGLLSKAEIRDVIAYLKTLRPE